MAVVALGATLVCSVASAEVDAALVSAVIAYGRANLDESTGLVKDGTRQTNVPQSSPGYLAALLIEGGHDNEVAALVGALLANQDRKDKSDTRGCFRWSASGSDAYSYDATLYALPVLAWCVQHHQRGLGSRAAELTDAVALATRALDKYSFEPDDEAYLMLQAAARASAGAALGDRKLVDRAQSAVDEWLSSVRAQGLPAGHSPSFDALRLATLYWLKASGAQASASLDTAIRLSRADAAARVWPAHHVLAGAAYHSFMSDYTASGGLSDYLCRAYFGTGALESVEPFVMHFLLPAPAPTPPAPHALPLTVRTSSIAPTKVTGTCTYVAPEFSLGTMSGTMSSSSLPIVIRFADPEYPEAIAATVFPAEGQVNSIQHNGMALCSINFDRIGIGSRKQAYVSFRLGRKEQIQEVLVRGAAWNREDTGIDQRDGLVFSTADCYVGIMIGRCGPVEGDTLRRVKPAELRWSGLGTLQRLQLDVYGRQSDFGLREPLHNVRVTLGICVAPASAYTSIEEFGAAFAQSRISEKIEQTVQRIGEESTLPQRGPTDGVIPDPKPKRDFPIRRLVQQTITWKSMGAEFILTEDLNAGELMSGSVDGVEAPREMLWATPGFSYAPGQQLEEALAAAGY
ncbi:MAG TPA: hypothetical protein DGT21_11325 [Armatimonadetes bacterium]|nr:hypothetical protein [Armatimonadota bacterium]